MSTLFTTMPDGTEVRSVCLENENLRAEVITYGGTLTSLKVPDRNGTPTEILLQYADPESYLTDRYLAALIGRYANRIGGARFSLNGKEYLLEKNDGENHLHGGSRGYYTKVWQILEETPVSVTLGLLSPDMDAGYPGNLAIRVTYSLEGPALRIRYTAECDQDTICNLTNHAYFNLSGDPARSIEADSIRIFADFYTPTDAHSIPTGAMDPVAGTPLDFREMTRIGQRINSNFEQLLFAGGYDHNFVIRGQAGTLRPAAIAESEVSGIVMTFETDQSGMQFYTGNFLRGAFARRSAFCLESQVFPDSPNKPDFPSCVLKKGETYRHTAVFRFSTDSEEP